MAETQVENQVCNACGADVRPGALFCYSCGGSLAPKVVAVLKDKKNVGDATLHDRLSGTNGDRAAKIEQPVIEKNTYVPISEPKLNKAPELKSAAAIRRQSKIYQPKRVEIIWEEYDNAPNGWFIFIAIVLTLLAAGILYLAIYLR